MLTKALVVASPGDPFNLQDVDIEETLRDDEVLVEMKATGVCHTDLNFSKEKTIPGLFPAVFGHEGAGVILKIGAKVTNTAPGDHVVLTYSCCGSCKYCKQKSTSYCHDFEKSNFGIGRSDGSKAYSNAEHGAITSHFFGQSSFSNRAVVMATSVVQISDKTLKLEDLAPLGCGIMTGAGAMLNVVKPKRDDIVCVVGTGAVGLAAIMALKLVDEGERPGMVIAVDVVDERLQSAEDYGATVTLNSRSLKGKEELKERLLELTAGKGIDGSIDTTGRPEVAGELLGATAKLGKVVQVGVGVLTAETSTNIFDTVNTGRTYVGCAMGSCHPLEFIPMLVGAWKRGDFPFTDLIKKYPAKDMNAAMKDVLSGIAVKAVLEWR